MIRVVIVMPHAVGDADSGDRLRTKNLVDALNGKGVKCDILYPIFPTSSSVADTSEHSHGFAVGSRAIVPRFAWRLTHAIKRYWDPFCIFDRKFERSLRRALRKLDPDVVDFQHTFTWVRTSQPSVCTVHNVEALSTGRQLTKLQRKAVLRRERRTFTNCSLLATLSDLDADRVKTVASNSATVRTVPIGVKAPNVSHPIRQDLRTIAFVGSFDYPPNVEAATWLRSWWSRRDGGLGLSRLLIIGRMAYRIGSEGLEGVEIMSDVPDVAQALHVADALVVPIMTGGGVRVKIIEALGLGIPIVTTMLGCEGLGLKHGVHASIASSPEDFDESLRLILSADKRQSLAENGLRLHADKFSPNSMGDEMLSLYCSLRHPHWEQS